MREAIALCKEMEVRLMTLEVRVTNDTAQNLYRKLGFPRWWHTEKLLYRRP